MSVVGWILVGIAAYLAVSFGIAVLVGRSFRDRDQQTPEQERTTR